MQGAGDAGTVVVAKVADVADDVAQILVGDLLGVHHDLVVQEAGLGRAAQVENDLKEVLAVGHLPDGAGDAGRQGAQQGVQVIGDAGGASLGRRCLGHLIVGLSGACPYFTT